MIKHIPVLTRVLMLLFLMLCPEGRAEESCGSLVHRHSLKKQQASAGFFANLSRTADSIQYQVDSMIDHALETRDAIPVPDVDCPSECPVLRRYLILNSAPSVRKENYRDEGYCQTLLDTTRTQPISFENREFPDRDTAFEWYSQLTMGKGKDGKALYRVCDRSCSPSYHTVVTRIRDEIRASSYVVCGHARDKSDDMYTLESSYEWRCASESK